MSLEARELGAVSLLGTDGAPLDLDAFAGRYLILFFFPRADTTGCTREARDFSELDDAFADAGATVVGISRDPPAKLARFGTKHDLRIRLASDPGALSEALGLWGEKTLYGRRYMGLERATILVDPDRSIVRAWRRVKVASHAESVLAELRALTN